MTNAEATAMLESLTWTVAKTMPWNPHAWTLKSQYPERAKWEALATFIQKHGDPVWFYKKIYHCIFHNGYRYWTMEDPPETMKLMNRAKDTGNGRRHDYYDQIADEYQNLFTSDEYIAENREIVGRIDVKGRVLDIGCGDGLLLDYAIISPEQYTGIDPSKGMLKYFAKKHPRHNAYPIPFENFYDKGFDTIISLFGSISYVNPESLGKIRKMLRRDGTAFLMFFKDGYVPVTHEKLNADIKYYLNNEPGEIWHNYKIVKYTM